MGIAACTSPPAIGESAEPPADRRSLLRLGPLQVADVNGVRLPPGFTSRIVARSGVAPVAGRPYRWHEAPDGGAIFAMPDAGWIYVSNSEVHGGRGGVGALRFDANALVVDAYPILAGTSFNCAGGPTPWGTWLSCEEHPKGQVWECDPRGVSPARVRPALGTFTHEAVAVDPATGQLYLTEDLPDGRWYRFTPEHVSPEGRAELDRGQLEAAVVDLTDGRVTWQAIPHPDGIPQPTRRQAADSTRFNGGEGCWFANGRVYFTTKGDDRVWLYDIRAGRIRILYDGESPQGARSALHGVDNVTGARSGEVLVAEDNGDMQIVAIAADGRSAPILQIEGQDSSEIAGPAFDPSGTRLYFSSQRGSKGDNDGGLTYEVSGPFPT